MAQLRFRCAQCDEWHESEPSIGFQIPDYLLAIPEPERASRAWWHDDLCVIDDQYHFARACLEVPILDAPEPFLWGIWVSLSAGNFEDYQERLRSGQSGGPYFSWLANQLPGYPSLAGLKAQTYPQAGTARPLVELERSTHPLSIDFHEGISQARAEDLFTMVLHPQGTRH